MGRYNPFTLLLSYAKHNGVNHNIVCRGGLE